MPYITAQQLTDKLGPQRFLALFDDTGAGAANANAVALVLDEAHAQIVSYIESESAEAPKDDGTEPVPKLYTYAEIALAELLAYERRPEYVRGQGELTMKDRWERFDALMARIKAADMVPDDPNAGEEPVNVGGAYADVNRHVALGSSTSPTPAFPVPTRMGDF
jgi:hypothetical protein